MHTAPCGVVGSRQDQSVIGRPVLQLRDRTSDVDVLCRKLLVELEVHAGV